MDSQGWGLEGASAAGEKDRYGEFSLSPFDFAHGPSWKSKAGMTAGTTAMPVEAGIQPRTRSDLGF
jgi:hypothetical protein